MEAPMERNQKELQELLNEFLALNPGCENQIGHECGASIPTIKRWAAGINFPSEITTKYAIEILKKKLGKK